MSDKPREKPILCLDFDGVIHSYEKGWQDGSIYGDLTPGFLDWAYQASKHFKLVIYSSRSKANTGTYDMAHWLADRTLADGWQVTDWPGGDEDVGNLKSPLRLLHAWRADVLMFYFAHEKPPAFLTIDDRALQFRGDWGAWWLEPEQLLKFVPWMNIPAPCPSEGYRTLITDSESNIIIGITPANHLHLNPASFSGVTLHIDGRNVPLSELIEAWMHEGWKATGPSLNESE